MNTPIGLAWRGSFVRCCSDCFDKPYLIEEMKRSVNNIVPVVVIDIITKKATIYLINSTMTDFDVISYPVLARKIEGIAEYMINKKNTQKSNLTVLEKEETVDLIEKRNYIKNILTDVEKARLQTLFTKANIPDVMTT